MFTTFKKHKIPVNHPRAESLLTREQLIKHFFSGVVTSAGLIAHGRGEAFDYLLGEKTVAPAKKAIRAAAASLLIANYPVISINGNVAALVAKSIIELAQLTNAKVEVNLFYRSHQRELVIKKLLAKEGLKEIYGVDRAYRTKIPEISSDRRWVDLRGIYLADLVFVPLEDGDRTQALVKLGKKVITVDLNPLSRTAQSATITIVDNITRTIPKLIDQVRLLKNRKRDYLEHIANEYNNQQILNDMIYLITKRLNRLTQQVKKKNVF